MTQRDFDLHLRINRPACAMMLDIDLFKQVNDTYGHLCGDRVLQAVANIIDRRLRRTDICGRYGGEEFLIFLPATTLEKAFPVAEQIRQSVEDKLFSCDHHVFHITVSIGLAQLDPARHKNLDLLIAQADSALYEAKNGGHNRVMPAIPNNPNDDTKCICSPSQGGKP